MIGFDSSAERRGFWRGVAVGLVAAGIVASCMAPPKARAQTTDDGATLAHARGADGSTVTLHMGRGECAGAARVAIWRPAPGRDVPAVRGCWVLAQDGSAVFVSFLDGERGDIPVGSLVKSADS